MWKNLLKIKWYFIQNIYKKIFLVSILLNQKIKFKKINMWLLIIDFDNIN